MDSDMIDKSSRVVPSEGYFGYSVQLLEYLYSSDQSTSPHRASIYQTQSTSPQPASIYQSPPPSPSFVSEDSGEVDLAKMPSLHLEESLTQNS